ncbi:hypothetical protein EC973_005880 [Apophysomyces ossiformis]|uniref:Uncharacterized protein n=1 Tax=Apophysomyces ossiformis TaxID=679940 RepID=A0A8H7BFS5_9FUNG|nr:hypothetical protein EC973_005880 [Apophysomyces ossiformis]
MAHAAEPKLNIFPKEIAGIPGSPPSEYKDIPDTQAQPSTATQPVVSPPRTPPGEKDEHKARKISQGEFESERHFYPRVLNAQIHPLVQSFFTLGNDRIIARYTHLNPQVKPEHLREILSYQPTHFQWAGSDLFNVTTASGQRQMIVIETNSCPSGQKSMPLLSETDEHNEQGGYRQVIQQAFQSQLSKADPKLGGLAVVCDKNMMESSGYAAVLSDVAKEDVWLVEWYVDDPDPNVKWEDGVLHIRDEAKAGGRNKMMAARAYDFYNSELVDTGLGIRTPETINNVTRGEIPLWIHSMGGHAVLKVPYSNAGQGVYTITNEVELGAFMAEDHHYDKFIVQSLVGNASWSSVTRAGKFYHVGTIPNKKSNTFVSDLRMMVAGSENGFRPVCIYGRKARLPLTAKLDTDVNTWDMLGTNLSLKLPDGSWTTDTSRLILMDRKDFNQLGLGIDDLIDAYIQTCLAVIAIDRMASRLMANGRFDYNLFRSLNPDNALLKEIQQANNDDF